MKALASEPERRYPTAEAFADDLDAVLASRPVRAHAPTRAYPAARFVRRHRALTAAAALVFASLLAATVVSSLSAQRARMALAEAQARASELTAVNGFVETMLTETEPEQGSSADMPMREVLQRAEQTLDDSKGSPRTQGQVALLLARAWSGLGESAKAQGALDRAQGWLDVGFGVNSNEAMQVRFTWIEDTARSNKPELMLAQATEFQQRLSHIDADWARTLAFNTRILRGQALEQSGDVDAAVKLNRELLADLGLAGLPESSELTDTLRHNLAFALNNSGDFVESERLLRETLASESKRIGADHPQTLYTKKALGQSLHRQGRLEEAAELYAEVHEKRRKRYGDDLPEARQLMVAALQAAFPGIEVATAANLREAFASIESPPQLALIDLGLPDGNGTQLIQALRSRCADTLCIVSTVFDDDAHLFPALRAGAQGYVLKNRDREALAGMLQGIASGQPPLSPSIARRLLRHFQPIPVESEDEAALTPRETEVLRLTAKGLTLQEVADTLGLSRHTVSG